jgi:hypothetical protein
VCHFDGKKLPQAASKNNDAASLKILKPVQIVQAVQPLGSIHHGDQPVPVVPIGEDVPEATILPERRRKTSGIVPDWPHHVVCSTRYCSSVRQVGVGADELRSKEAFAFANVHSNERFR